MLLVIIFGIVAIIIFNQIQFSYRLINSKYKNPNINKQEKLEIKKINNNSKVEIPKFNNYVNKLINNNVLNTMEEMCNFFLKYYDYGNEGTLVKVGIIHNQNIYENKFQLKFYDHTTISIMQCLLYDIIEFDNKHKLYCHQKIDVIYNQKNNNDTISKIDISINVGHIIYSIKYIILEDIPIIVFENNKATKINNSDLSTYYNLIN